MSATELAPLDAVEARTLTDTIKGAVAEVWDLVKAAYTRRAWVALGYPDWDTYCAAEFDGARLRLPREERAEVVSSLREAGLSVRAIASATGDSVGTVHNALPTGVQNRTPVTGTDGKRYKPVESLNQAVGREEHNARRREDRKERPHMVPAPLDAKAVRKAITTAIAGTWMDNSPGHRDRELGTIEDLDGGQGFLRLKAGGCIVHMTVHRYLVEEQTPKRA